MDQFVRGFRAFVGSARSGAGSNENERWGLPLTRLTGLREPPPKFLVPLVFLSEKTPILVGQPKGPRLFLADPLRK